MPEGATNPVFHFWKLISRGPQTEHTELTCVVPSTKCQGLEDPVSGPLSGPLS